MTRSSRLLRGAIGAALVGGAVLGTAAPALADHEGDLFAVDINNVLHRFDPATPETIEQQAPITGLEMGAVVLGIDVRPADGEIDAITQNERVYRIDHRPGGFGAAQFVSALTSANGTAAGPQLDGTNSGFDFNPAVDRLRVVSDRRQNLRIEVDTGATTVDALLTYRAGDANAGKQPRVTAVADTNPDLDPATGTELFDIDPGQGGTNDIVSKQVDPNGGLLATRGNTGSNNGNLVGYDIDADATGYASLVNTDVPAQLLVIRFDDDPATDDAPTFQSRGQIGTPELRDITAGLVDADGRNPFAVAPDPVVPDFPVVALGPLAALAVGGAVLVRRRNARAQPRSRRAASPPAPARPRSAPAAPGCAGRAW